MHGLRCATGGIKKDDVRLGVRASSVPAVHSTRPFLFFLLQRCCALLLSSAVGSNSSLPARTSGLTLRRAWSTGRKKSESNLGSLGAHTRASTHPGGRNATPLCADHLGSSAFRSLVSNRLNMRNQADRSAGLSRARSAIPVPAHTWQFCPACYDSGDLGHSSEDTMAAVRGRGRGGGGGPRGGAPGTER